MPTLASMIKEDGSIYVVVLSNRGDPIAEWSEEDWRKLAVKSYDLLKDAHFRKDELKQEGKFTDPFWFYTGEHGV